MLYHAGEVDGFSALVSLMPQDSIGTVVLTNLKSTPMPSIIAFAIHDRLLGLDQIPWNLRLKKDADNRKSAKADAERRAVADRKTGTQPSHPLEDYIGDFEHPGYGIFTIAKEAAGLEASYNSTFSPLEHYHYDTFTFAVHGSTKRVTFSTDVHGDVDRLSVPLETAVGDIVFTRQK